MAIPSTPEEIAEGLTGLVKEIQEDIPECNVEHVELLGVPCHVLTLHQDGKKLMVVLGAQVAEG